MLDRQRPCDRGSARGVVLRAQPAKCGHLSAVLFPRSWWESGATFLAFMRWDDPSPGSVAMSPWGIRCFGIALLVGTLVLISFVLALRRSVPVASRLRGAALGAAAGAWAGLTVFAFCPSGDQWHILFGHVLPLVVLILLGALVAPARCARDRSQRHSARPSLCSQRVAR
jgi:Negative regulator of sigma F